MSMQRIHNYGSTLQAYSLRRLVEQTTDARVSFLDYRPGDVLVRTDSVRRSKSHRVLNKLLEYNTPDVSIGDRLRFFNHKRAYGRNYFSDAGIPLVPDYSRNVDCQIVGSDEVFNCVQANTKVGYSRDLFGYRTRAQRLISYAGSFGNTTLDKICAAGIREDVAHDLAMFDALSVRDQNSLEIVRELTGREPLLHVDPALAYDLVHDPRVPSTRLHADPYMIVYGYSGRLTADENAALRSYARKTGVRILTLGGVQKCGDAFIDCSPFELLAYIRDATSVVTDTFHGTIFSIINHRPFATIVRPSSGTGYGNEEKLGFLLKLFGLSRHRVDRTFDIEKVLSISLDLDAIERTLASERSKSIKYLGDNVPVSINQEIQR